MTRWLEKLVDRFWNWVEEVCAEPDERTDPPHEYAKAGTLNSYRHGNRCLYCGTRDDKRRAHNDQPCERPYRPELA
jgi:hypothetical protein